MQNTVSKNQFSRLVITALALIALMGMAGSALAQTVGRVFTPSLIGTGTIIDPYGAHAAVVNGTAYPISVKTQALVNPYLYVSGNLDVLFTVDGWGAGSSSYDTTFGVWHNMKVTLALSGFDNLVATNDATRTLPMNLSSVVTDTGGANTWFTSTSAHGITVSSWPELTTSSGGHFNVTLTRQILLDPTIGPLPGTNMYTNTAAINVTPTW